MSSCEPYKDGKKYVCTQVSGPPTPGGSLAHLCHMAQRGNGETIYHSNGKVFTNFAGQKGATWYYDNGLVLTHSGPAMTAEELMYPCESIR